MQLVYMITILAITAPATASTALTSATSAKPVSNEDTSYIAPLIEPCPAGRSTCGKIEGKYMVMLREGYKASFHLSYISANIHVDPVKDWQLKWHGDDTYTVQNIEEDSLNLLRRDLGVEEIEEGHWFEQISEVDRCQDPASSEEERRRCYDSRRDESWEESVLLENEERTSAGKAEVLFHGKSNEL
ncbi:hypothetical protein QM012_002139 [Aureobasidium pullulans]|uniref:Uncharacterized protein n=1 Tax=Aureobasidium pullulans TaxID=5580 RepID=A0ABR0TB67_AURPU